MTKTITLTQIRVLTITVDYVRNAVVAKFQVLDAGGTPWETMEATFWVTMPPQQPIYAEDGITITGYQPYPDTWFQLPVSYVAPLVGMMNDATAAIQARFLV